MFHFPLLRASERLDLSIFHHAAIWLCVEEHEHKTQGGRGRKTYDDRYAVFNPSCKPIFVPSQECYQPASCISIV